MSKKHKEEFELPFLGDPKDSDVAEAWYIKYLDTKRIILINSDINEDIAKEVCGKLIAFNLLDSKKPIFIYLNSEGGSLSSAFAVINTIRRIKAPVMTIIYAEACSAAGLISIVGNKRYIYDNSYWMEHPTSAMISEDVHKIKDRAKYLAELDIKTEALMKQCTTLTKRDLAKIRTGELWLNAKQCLKKNVVDEIITTFKRRKTKTELPF